ncbi:MAG: LysR family transcriptional regulator [Deltaproteobacteria bacterium HGW-Deltaproteobacteria-14]|jgi:DNA-binding transcriptional LysR family regulator|nr:MAG: LysR family transcriptional regulator [Deltaproteobacteria bacterium HGW-Deltaproteobacteria-14]
MSRPDLNLLVALEVLLAEESVVGAARRMRLSPSAMSRTLARLRETTGDPLLVPAGRGLVPTRRALEIRDRVSQLVQDAEALLRPAGEVDLAALARTFTVRAGEGFVETFGPDLLARVAAAAPEVRLRFVQRLDRDSGPLRDGSVDLDVGVVGAGTGPEIRAQALFRDQLIGVVRAGHPLSRGPVSAAAYAAGHHVEVARHAPAGHAPGPIDGALEQLGLEREIVAVVSGFSTAIALARTSDLIASVPERHTASVRAGVHGFPLPLPLPGLTVSLLWHPRVDADPAHRWLRGQVRDACAHQRQLMGRAGHPEDARSEDAASSAE